MPVSEKAILTLLDDTNKLSVAEAMRIVLKEYERPEEFIKRHQDGDNPRIRRHVQQLSCLLGMEREYDALVGKITSKKASLWDCIVSIALLSDSSLNRDYLLEYFDNFCGSVTSGLGNVKRVTTSQILSVIRETHLHVSQGPEFFNLSNLILWLCLDDGGCHPLVLCEILRQVGSRVGWYPNIVMWGGNYKLATPEGTVLSPENDWNVIPNLQPNQCHVCSNSEMVLSYLGLLHVMSVVSRRPIAIYNFTRILAEISHSSLDNMPYPFGNKHYTSLPNWLSEVLEEPIDELTKKS